MENSISRHELIKKLRKFGFEGPFSGSKHQFMKKGSLKLRIPNPHKSEIDKAILTEIIKQTLINKNDWESVDN